MWPDHMSDTSSFCMEKSRTERPLKSELPLGNLNQIQVAQLHWAADDATSVDQCQRLHRKGLTIRTIYLGCIIKLYFNSYGV